MFSRRSHIWSKVRKRSFALARVRSIFYTKCSGALPYFVGTRLEKEATLLFLTKVVARLHFLVDLTRGALSLGKGLYRK